MNGGKFLFIYWWLMGSDFGGATVSCILYPVREIPPIISGAPL